MNIPKKALLITFVIVAAIVAVAAAAPNTKQRAWRDALPAWYAVHLASGQTYYGRLQAITDTTLALSDAHYFEVYETKTENKTATSTNFTVTQAPQTIYNLVRQGSDQNTATDHTIFFNRAAVLFWERLDPAAGVVKNIVEAAKK
ncbi:hypothetical protein HY839_00980 [Candidatus Azambacteria bacterium]|nr:hypothetical protein [Candidatus Azambacteria bacterium]